MAERKWRAVLLLHGYGENRSIWKDFEQELLKRGWAVMALDLRERSGRSQQRRNYLSRKVRISCRRFPQAVVKTRLVAD